MKDLFGKAIIDFYNTNIETNIITETNISEADEMPVSYLFRNYVQMPVIEQTALQLCYGKVLDVGCGAGSHSLYLQNELHLDVMAIDISENAIKVCDFRGIKNAEQIDILEVKQQKFDTIIMLMNGTGIFKTLSEIPAYLKKLQSLLNDGGQVLIDSSDLIYMFDDDNDGAKLVPADGYYGELTFNISYINEIEDPFKWLYVDYNTLQNACNSNGFSCSLICEGTNFDYLAKLQLL